MERGRRKKKFRERCRQERDLQTRTDRFGVEVRERVKWDIREGVVGADTFNPKHVVIITWKNMSFAGGIDNSLYKVSCITNYIIHTPHPNTLYWM